MKHEEKIQEEIERGIHPDTVDHKAYEIVFHTLEKEQPTPLPPDFAIRVMRQILSREQSKSSSRDIWWLILGALSITIAAVVAMALSGFKPGLGFLSALSEFRGLIIFGACFIALLQFIERRLPGLKKVAEH